MRGVIAGLSCEECYGTTPAPAHCKSCPPNYPGMLSCSKCTASTPLAGCKGCPNGRSLWDNKNLRCGEAGSCAVSPGCRGLQLMCIAACAHLTSATGIKQRCTGSLHAVARSILQLTERCPLPARSSVLWQEAVSSAQALAASCTEICCSSELIQSASWLALGLTACAAQPASSIGALLQAIRAMPEASVNRLSVGAGSELRLAGGSEGASQAPRLASTQHVAYVAPMPMLHHRVRGAPPIGTRCAAAQAPRARAGKQATGPRPAARHPLEPAPHLDSRPTPLHYPLHPNLYASTPCDLKPSPMRAAAELPHARAPLRTSRPAAAAAPCGPSNDGPSAQSPHGRS